MKKAEAVERSEQALAELADALAAGKSEKLMNYLDTMSRFHKYSFGNCLLIAQQRPAATHVAGFSAWKKLGRTIKKGEKGICILAPLVRKLDEYEAEKEKSRLFGFRAVHVFDIAQTEGDALPEFSSVRGDPGTKLAMLRQVAANRQIDVSYKKELGGAYGISRGGEIYLLESLSPAADFATLAHEIAHELLHRGQDRAEFSQNVKELEAEAVAYVVSKSVGLENSLQQSADYIHLYSGDKEQLTKSLDRICRVASALLADLEKLESLRTQKATQA